MDDGAVISSSRPVLPVIQSHLLNDRVILERRRVDGGLTPIITSTELQATVAAGQLQTRLIAVS